VLDGFELGDPREAHHLGLAKGLVGKERVELFARLRAGDQDAACWRNRRAGQQEAARIVALLQEATVRRDERGIALLEGNEMLSFQKKVLH